MKDLEAEDMSVGPGSARLRPDGKPLAVCVAVPAGTLVEIVSAGGSVVSRSKGGVLVQDGTVLVRNPKLCSAAAAVQNASLR